MQKEANSNLPDKNKKSKLVIDLDDLDLNQPLKRSSSPSPNGSGTEKGEDLSGVAGKEGEIDLNSPEYHKEQEEIMKFYQRKREIEEQDAAFARSLLFSEGDNPPEPTTRPSPKDDEDYLLALKLSQQGNAVPDSVEEVQGEPRKAEGSLKRTYTDLISDEPTLQELPKRERTLRDEEAEWEETLQLIKRQAKEEADEKLASLMREKEELERRLHEVQSIPKEVSLSIDSIPYPSYWDPQASNHQTFELKRFSPEWTRVAGEFLRGLPSTHIRNIIRNQNKKLWMWYHLKKLEMEAKNGDLGANELMAFHGSRANAYEIILSEGFDHRVASMSGAIGAGIYFALSSLTSMGYVSGSYHGKRMLFCRVLAGDVGPGRPNLRRPPEKNTILGKTILYDSVGTIGSVYVVFDNCQSYPEYDIHF
eukprot:TRINITY_DN2942_c0_g1_i2.p1 TRINITY_DN2942_c0_g1~~TRINITY_DN2942_c0_g1_i2.p1  ORF type:complete len:421 (+),score=83.98 TRINITY_DN2942_c0_g1_i2:45-1307(+)